MVVHLNRRAFNPAKELINEGKVVLDERDAWSEHQGLCSDQTGKVRARVPSYAGRSPRKGLQVRHACRADRSPTLGKCDDRRPAIPRRGPCAALSHCSTPG